MSFMTIVIRTGWIADNQPDIMTKNILKRRLYDIYNKTKKALPPAKLRDNFLKKI